MTSTGNPKLPSQCRMPLFQHSCVDSEDSVAVKWNGLCLANDWGFYWNDILSFIVTWSWWY